MTVRECVAFFNVVNGHFNPLYIYIFSILTMLLYLVLFAFPPQYFPPSFFPHSIPLLQSIFHFSALPPPPPSLSSFLPTMSDVTIGFEQSSYTIPEAIGTLEVVVKAVGTLAQPVTVTLTTKDGTAICEDSWISLCPPLLLYIFFLPLFLRVLFLLT